MRITDSKVQSGYEDTRRFDGKDNGGMPAGPMFPPGIPRDSGDSPAYPSAGHGVPNSYAQQPLMSNQQFAGPHAQVQSQGVMPGMRRSQI